MDDFLAEAKAQKIRTLEELNYYWKIYLDEYYHNRAHDGIREYYESLGVSVPREGISPIQEFNRDTRLLWSSFFVTFMAKKYIALLTG